LQEFKEGSRDRVRQSRWSISVCKVTIKSATTAIGGDHRRFSLKPEARGSGLAAALVENLLEHASKEVEQVQLTVVATNARARRFYQRMGFVEYGLEKESLKEKDAYFDEVLMVRFLSRKQ
jgi:ribosomal protein S18 acetylase RimI-like enzyme